MKTISDDELSESSSVTDTSAAPNIIDVNVDVHSGERLTKSRERNREHARRTRLRKKAQMQDLQLRMQQLEAERKVLKQSIEECSIASILLGLSGNGLDEEENEGIVTMTEDSGIGLNAKKRKRSSSDCSDLIIKINGVETIVGGNGKTHVNWKTGVYTDEHGAQHTLTSNELEALR